MKFVSFFAGVGGLDLGLEQAGYDCLAQVEIDKNCQKVLRYQYPEVKRFGDVSKINPKDLPEADLYVGGFPCQDLSLGNTRRKGFEGKRSSLWHEFIRCVEYRAPTYVLAENVKGLLSARNGEDMGIVVKSLADRGYSCEWRVLDSQYFGVPQRRKRGFIVGTKIDRHLGGKPYKSILFEQKSLSGDIDKGNKAQQDITSPIERSSGKTDKGIKGCLVDKDGLKVQEPYRVFGIDGVAPTLTTGKKTILDIFIKSKKPSYKDDFERWTTENVHPTLTCFDNGDVRTNAAAVTNEYKVRRLTPIECERLHGLPDDWTKLGIDDNGDEVKIPETARYRQMGNAVTVPVAKWIGLRLKKVIKELE